MGTNGIDSAVLCSRQIPTILSAGTTGPDQFFFFLIPGAGHVDHGAGIGGDDHPDAFRDAEPKCDVILGERILDSAIARRNAVEMTNDSFLH